MLVGSLCWFHAPLHSFSLAASMAKLSQASQELRTASAKNVLMKGEEARRGTGSDLILTKRDSD